MPHDSGRDVPALPARLRGPVAEVDVLAVVTEAGVPAVDLLEQRAAHEEEGAEHPIGLHGLGGTLVEGVVLALGLVRRAEPAKRRAAYDRATHGRKAPPGRLPAAVRPLHLRARDPTARASFCEIDE